VEWDIIINIGKLCYSILFMTECAHCNRKIETLRTKGGKTWQLPFTCVRCKQQFCANHRLPENHYCSSRVVIRPKDYWGDKLPKKKKSNLGIIALLLILVAAAVVYQSW